MKKIKRILIVEDETIIAKELKMRLENLGYQVCAISFSGSKAIQLIDELKPDLVLMDILLQGEMDGIETVEKIHECTDIPVIYLTAHSDEKTLERAKKTEPYGYMLKPFQDRELKSMIDTAFYKHEIQQKLKESESKYRQVVESVSDIIFTTDINGNLLFSNAAGLKISGYSIDDIMKLNYLDLVIPEYQQRLKIHYMKQYLKREDTSYFEYPFRAKDGSIRWFGQNVTLIVKDNEVVGYYCIARDITEHIHFNESLRKQLSEKELILETMLDGYIFADSEGEIIDVNPAYCQMIGYSKNELLQMNIRDVDVRFQPGEVEHKIQQMVKIGKDQFETKHRCKDGDILDLEVSFSILKIDEIPFITAFVRDITDRKQKDEVLRESEERFRLAFENTNIGMCLVDLAGRLTRVNPQMCEIFGYKKEELESMTVNNIAHPEDKDISPQYIDKAKSGEIEQFQFEKRYLHKDGSIVLGQVSSSLVKNTQGEPLYFISHVQDITDHKRIESVLRKSEEKYRAIVEDQTELICRFKPDCTLTFVNESYARNWGKFPDELIGVNFLTLIPERSRENAKKHFNSFSPVNAVQIQEHEVISGTGEICWQQWSNRAFFDEEGNIVEFQSVGRDITERKKAEQVQDAIYKISEAAFFTDNLKVLYHSIHEIVGELMPVTNFYIALQDSETDILSFPYFVDEEEDTPEPYKAGKGRTEYVLRTGQPLLASPKVFEALVKSGEVVSVGPPPVDWLGVPLRLKDKTVGVLVVQSYTEGKRYDEEDKDILMFVSAQIAMTIERKKAEEQIQKDLKEKGVLLKEIHHRVKNNLQIISSLLSLQSRHIKDKRILEMFEESRNRVRSMALVHEELYRSGDFTNIKFDEYVEELIDGIRKTYFIEPDRIEFKVDLEDVSLEIDQAIPCGLIINELVSNALKHAFPPSFEGKGKIELTLRSMETGEFELIVQDNGLGLPKDLDIRKTESLGMQLIYILTEEQLEGTVNLDTEKGAKFKIRFK